MKLSPEACSEESAAVETSVGALELCKKCITGGVTDKGRDSPSASDVEWSLEISDDGTVEPLIEDASEVICRVFCS